MNAAAVGQAMRDVRAVFHLGAFMSWLAQDQARLFAANVEGTRVVLEAALAAKVQRFIFASSGEVYPEGAPEFLPVDETHPLKPRSAYGLTKLLGEEMLRWAGRSHGLAFTILRFSHTQDATELLDPESFFSGPASFFSRASASRKGSAMPRQSLPCARRMMANRPMCSRKREWPPLPHDDHRDARHGGGPSRRLRYPAMVGETCNLGATEAVDFAEALPKMAAITGLPVRAVNLPGAGVFYETSNARIRQLTGFEPVWTFDRMLEEAAIAWRAKRKS